MVTKRKITKKVTKPKKVTGPAKTRIVYRTKKVYVNKKDDSNPLGDVNKMMVGVLPTVIGFGIAGAVLHGLGDNL